MADGWVDEFGGWMSLCMGWWMDGMGGWMDEFVYGVVGGWMGL